MRSRKELADAIRILSMDAVDKAKSGHPVFQHNNLISAIHSSHSMCNN